MRFSWLAGRTDVCPSAQPEGWDNGMKNASARMLGGSAQKGGRLEAIAPGTGYPSLKLDGMAQSLLAAMVWPVLTALSAK
jgi:hypothetical protein